MADCFGAKADNCAGRCKCEICIILFAIYRPEMRNEMKIEDIKAYEILEKRRIEDLNSESYLLRHKKTGARVALLSNDDENKVFYIGFRTPPKDSTGVAHIIEHTVLCGSEKFPLKDPFVELAKGSLNTFLNAMTYPDKTVYPVASCNDADFQNLCDVYLDAVFHPNIGKTEKIFRQEGWHYELEDKDSDLTINGVVYSEMKGAFSSPDDVLSREVLNSLFPDTTYSVESGGDPDVIPELTYEEYLNFHKTYYHPSNSYIYLYGNMDMAEKLAWMDEEYLSQYEALQVDSEIGMQEAFGVEKPREIIKKYPITDGESEQDAAYLTYNAVVGTSLDPKLYLAFQVLDYALGSATGAPLEKALIEKGIGKVVYSYYDNGIRQPYFTVVAKDANADQKEEFLATVREVFEDQVKNGIDKKSLEAAVNSFEFKYREADFGSYPKGLMYGLQMFDSWLYDDTKPFIHVEANDTFAFLRSMIETDYFEKLVDEYLVHAKHSSLVVLEPEKGLTAKKDRELAEKLSAYKASLTEKEIEKIITDTRELRAYQEAEDSKEALEKLPLLTRADMKKQTAPIINEERSVDGSKVLFHDVYTNGIGYINFIFDMSKLPAELYPYAGLLKAVYGHIDTKDHSFVDLNNEINRNTGGYSINIGTYTNAENIDEFKVTFEVKVKAFYHKLPEAFALIKEMLLTSDFEMTQRLSEIIAEGRSRMQAGMMRAGHSVAATHAMSYFSQTAVVMELTNGIELFRILEHLDDDFEAQKDELVRKLKLTAHTLLRPENLMLDYTAQEKGYAGIPELFMQMKQSLFTDSVKQEIFDVNPVRKNEGFFTAGKVQYVCRAGNYRKKGLPYTGALRVLRTMMGYDYLWNQVRVKGGAYGCMSNFSRMGDCYFVSYRDPHLAETIKIYEGAADYLRKFDADERELTKYIIGTISDMDIPLTPSAKGDRSLVSYLCHYPYEEMQKERDEVLGVTVADIRRLADYVEAFMEDDCLCVIGNEEEIRKNKNLFLNMENLFY